MKEHNYLQTMLSKFTSGRSGVRRTRVPRHVQRTPQPVSRLPVILSLLMSILVIAGAWLRIPAYPGNADLWRKQSIYQVGVLSTLSGIAVDG